MIREDYIMRMIEQIAALVARIMNQKISQESLDEELDGLAEKWIGLPSGMLLALPPEEAFSLIEDSDRMVVEKSYLMGELYRLKGVHSQSLDEKKDYFAKSLYFIDKCPGRVSPELQSNIDATLEELRMDGAVNPYVAPDPVPQVEMENPAPKTSHAAVVMRKRRKKKASAKTWYALAAVFAVMLLYSLFSESEIEISDIVASFENGLAQATFEVTNNTNERRIVKLRLSVEHSTREVFGSNHSFLGFVEREYTIEPKSAEKVFEEFEYFLDAPRPGQTISVALVSNLIVGLSEPNIEDL